MLTYVELNLQYSMFNIITEIWTLLCEMSPYLLLGFLLAGLMHEFIPSKVYTKYLGINSLKSVVLAALFGVPLPLCSCGVIPTAMGIRKEGASKGATISFLIATPQTGVDSIIATYSLMGLPFALIRPVVALLTAVFGGVLCNVFDSEDEIIIARKEQCQIVNGTPQLQSRPGAKASGKLSNNNWTTRLFRALSYAFGEMMEDIGKWLVIGLIVAGIITAVVPDS